MKKLLLAAFALFAIAQSSDTMAVGKGKRLPKKPAPTAIQKLRNENQSLKQQIQNDKVAGQKRLQKAADRAARRNLLSYKVSAKRFMQEYYAGDLSSIANQASPFEGRTHCPTSKMRSLFANNAFVMLPVCTQIAHDFAGLNLQNLANTKKGLTDLAKNLTIGAFAGTIAKGKDLYAADASDVHSQQFMNSFFLNPFDSALAFVQRVNEMSKDQAKNQEAITLANKALNSQLKFAGSVLAFIAELKGKGVSAEKINGITTSCINLTPESMFNFAAGRLAGNADSLFKGGAAGNSVDGNAFTEKGKALSYGATSKFGTAANLTDLTKEFVDNIRATNQALALAVLGAFKINPKGQTYFSLNSITPNIRYSEEAKQLMNVPFDNSLFANKIIIEAPRKKAGRSAYVHELKKSGITSKSFWFSADDLRLDK